MSWVLVSCSLLAIGLLILIGLNLALGDKQIDAPLSKHYSVGEPQFMRAMSLVIAPAFVPGNRIAALLNGDEIFPAMLDAMRHARASITLETYIYWAGSIGDEFSDAFAQAARRGVAVKILLDGVGGSLDHEHLQRMRDAGCEVRRYNPPRWSTLATMNNRTHRKLMVVDGRIEFIGGVGIADEWRGHAQDLRTGATRISGRKARLWHNCSQRSSTTGCSRPAKSCTATSGCPP